MLHMHVCPHCIHNLDCNQGLYRSPNVLEFDFVTQVPLTVLEFMTVFLNVLKTCFLCCYMIEPTVNDCVFCACGKLVKLF